MQSFFTVLAKTLKHRNAVHTLRQILFLLYIYSNTSSCQSVSFVYIRIHFRHDCKVVQNDYDLRHVCPSVRMEQLHFTCSLSAFTSNRITMVTMVICDTKITSVAAVYTFAMFTLEVWLPWLPLYYICHGSLGSMFAMVTLVI